MTAPRIVVQCSRQLASDRVPVDIAHDFEKMAVRLDQHRFVSTSEDLAVFAVAAVESLGIHPVDLPHTAGDIAVRRGDQQVIVVRHQTVGGDLDVPPGRRFPEDLKK